jgi:hypothetical protein
MLRHVDPLTARLGLTSPSNLSTLCQLSAYNANLGYHHLQMEVPRLRMNVQILSKSNK